MADKPSQGRKLAREILGLFLLFWGLLLLLSLLTYNISDPTLNQTFTNAMTAKNSAGLFGAFLSGLLVDIFGISSYLWAVFFLVLGSGFISSAYEIPWWRWSGFVLLWCCICVAGQGLQIPIGDMRGGGLLGMQVYSASRTMLSVMAVTMIWFFVLLVALSLMFSISWPAVAASLWHMLCAGVRRISMPTVSMPTLTFRLPRFSRAAAPDAQAVQEESAEYTELVPELTALHTLESVPEPVHEAEYEAAPTPAPELVRVPPAPAPEPANVTEAAPKERGMLASVADAVSPVASRLRVRAKIPLPSLDLLEPKSANEVRQDKVALELKGKDLMACFQDFGIDGELVRITPGPVVTMFEVRPAPGVKVNRIASLSDDLARKLKALSVRIQAPIPGQDTVGIEIPNEQRENVCFRELLQSDTFKKFDGLLPLALGKDITGHPITVDLARLLHMLVAGATGAGKSVCLNSILLSLLYKARPDELNLLLIDPKRVELASYADLPHLVHPVVTDMQLAKAALEWATHEMDQRYTIMEQFGVRNIVSYNQKIDSFAGKPPPEFEELQRWPYLVIVIDELADLMLTAAREVETCILRLTQLGRAAGVHLILATQRPSVDVVTGLIKANVPCRIAFQVASRHDSRTILDTVGAEYLLGKGDMLFKPSGGKLQRLHGAFVSDKDVNSVVNYWKRQGPPNYKVNLAEWGNPSEEGSSSGGGADLSHDPMYQEALKFVKEQGLASASLLQRRFSIGYPRAARYIGQMEKDGLVGPADGSKPRQVLRRE